MIQKVAHFADIHLKDYKTDKEYREVFERVYDSLKENPVDRIIVAGDLFHTKNNVRNEAKLLAKDFLNSLSQFAPVRVINGNHDGNPNNKEQLNSLKTLIELISNDKIQYYDKSTAYVDENVQWMVWDYFDQQDPYQNSVIDKKLTTIDLFHNPVSDCVFYGGMVNKGGFSIDNFKGKHFFLGDIHKRQFFTNSHKSLGAYPGSLIQQSYGESLHPHGYLIWDLSKNSYQEIDIHNDYCFQTLRINSNDMVDQMDANSIDPNFKHINLRVVWEEKQGNINIEEERKLRKKINSLWGEKILRLKIVKNPIRESFGDILNENQDVENDIDVTNNSSLETIMRLYLKENGWEDDKIERILQLDKSVSDTLVWEYNSIQWKLKKLELENYRSHGDKFTLDLTDKTGLFQIKGLNEQGKTNLLSSIMYLLYGKTLETKKKEKNGDLRFVNNKTTKDFCRVSGVIEINGEDYELERITERKWNRGKTEASSSTKFNWTCNSVSENEENRIKSQKILDSAIGNFEDFLRASFITADSLNGLLSQDESEFLDALLRDSGMEIFEKKMEAWKKWEKENALFNRNIDIYQEELEIDIKKNSIRETEEEIERLKALIIIKKDQITTQRQIKDELAKNIKDIPTLRKIQDVDEDIQTINSEIQNLLLIKETHVSKLKTIKDFTKEDEDKYEELNIQLSEFETFKIESQTSISKIKDEINQLEKDKTSIENEIKFDQQIIHTYNKDIENIEDNYNNIVEKIEKENEDLKKSENCITCSRKLDKESLIKIEEKIELNKKKIKFILEEEIINETSTVILQIREKEKVIDKSRENIETLTKEIVIQFDKIKEVEKDFISKFELSRDVLTKKQNLDAKREIAKSKEATQMKIDNIDLKVQNLEKDVITLNTEKENIISWKDIELNQITIKSNITAAQYMIESIELEVTTLNKNLSQKELVELANYIRDIETSVKSIELQKEYEKEMIIRNGYQNLIHRNGLPKYLLTKLKNNINISLSNLLSSLSFSSGFDDNMYLRMWDNINPDKTMHVLNGSGKQRTFIALALRLALRTINTTCVNDLLFLDELMGKLVENSVEEFIELLDEIKTKISKVFIVEHAYSEFLNPDFVLEVKKDEKGVSSIIF